MATAANINVTLNANTAQHNAALAGAANATGAYGQKARAAGAGVGQSMQAAAYAFQDFTSVLENGGKNALGRAFGAISNNIGTITAGFGPWGMLAGTIGGVIAQLVIPRLFATKDATDDVTTAVDRLAKAHEDAAKRASAAWDRQVDRMREQTEFQANLFDPTKTTEQIGETFEQKKKDLEANQKELAIRIKQGNDLLNDLNAEGKTGLGAGIMQKGGIEALDKKQVDAMQLVTEKHKQDQVGWSNSDVASFGVMSALQWAFKGPDTADITAKPVDDKTKEALQARIDEINKLKENIKLNEEQIAQAKELNGVLRAGDDLERADAKKKELDDALKNHQDVLAQLEINKREDLEKRVFGRFQSESGSVRAGTSSAAYGSTDAYSAIAKATRTTGEADIKQLIEVEKRIEQRQKDIKKAIEDAALKATVVSL